MESGNGFWLGVLRLAGIVVAAALLLCGWWRTKMESGDRFWPRVLRLAGTVLTVGLLLFSWYACYLYVMGLTEGWGAPWDTTSIRPPIGYWQRSVNDFFESGIGMYLPTALFLTVSLVLYLYTLAKTRAVAETSFVFGLGNLAALVALAVLVIPITILLIRKPAYLTPENWSYWGDLRREWPLTLVALLLFAGLFLLQPWLAGRLAQLTKRRTAWHSGQTSDGVRLLRGT